MKYYFERAFTEAYRANFFETGEPEINSHVILNR